MSILAFERYERCIVSVILGRVTCRGCTILVLLGDDLYCSAVCICNETSFSVVLGQWNSDSFGEEARCSSYFLFG